ncbi:MAG: methyltransferase [Chitinophagia bacterium]|jgi:tRNA1Val (adenine37-N6)-methyltransferase
MPNDYFQFQQFRVQQGKAAMKVCTDACIFGAWLAREWRGADGLLLDIGTGTGLLSLQVAQETQCRIEAIEIEMSAYQQADENFKASLWANRIRALKGDIRSFEPEYLYDFVISNPPFYENDLVSDNAKRNLALHSSELTLESLIFGMNKLLQPGGKWALLLPARRRNPAIENAEKNGWKLIKECMIRNQPSSKPFRHCLLFSRNVVNETEREDVYIKDNGVYSDWMQQLLQPYYLAFT